MTTSSNVPDGELEELLDHLVFQQGIGPNGSGGEIRYWKNGEDITAKAAIERLIATSNQQAVQKALIDFGTSVVAKVQEVHDAPLPGRKNPEDYWKGHSDLAYALCEFIGKSLTATQPQKDGDARAA